VTKVKICGITNLEDAVAACEAGADALGFVFAPEAKARGRYLDPDEACRIIQVLPPFVTTVAVCVNETPARLQEYLHFADYVQLCGEETVEVCLAVAPRAIKAFRAGPGFKLTDMLLYPVAASLLDASVPGAHGGTGVRCDWDLAQRAVTLGRPVILSGGLTPENVAKAVEKVRPYAVDVSGGVESAPGKKDHERIRCFIQNARTSLS
jgi:phosphoribosylanthranilate isomerase